MKDKLNSSLLSSNALINGVHHVQNNNTNDLGYNYFSINIIHEISLNLFFMKCGNVNQQFFSHHPTS